MNQFIAKTGVNLNLNLKKTTRLRQRHQHVHTHVPSVLRRLVCGTVCLLTLEMVPRYMLQKEAQDIYALLTFLDQAVAVVTASLKNSLRTCESEIFFRIKSRIKSNWRLRFEFKSILESNHGVIVRNFNVSLQQIYCGPLSQEVKMFPICSG